METASKSYETALKAAGKEDCKAFYMRLNEDGKTVAAMDLLCPGEAPYI